MNKMNAIAIFFCLISLSIQSQSDLQQIVQASLQKINGGLVMEAISDLTQFLADDPNDAAVQRLLGLAFRRSADYPKSLEAYEKAYSLEPQNINGMFNLGVAYALAEDKDHAFELLEQVRSSGTFNITNIGLSPAAAFLQEDPRYQKLFPSPEDFADPFLEREVSILHEWQGEQANDQFGWVARNVGDVDGDGIMDLTCSAPTSNEGATGAGKIYLYSGKSGTLLWAVAAKDENGQMGMSIEAAGDVNGDGKPDVVAGAPYVNKTWVFSGTDGTLIHEWIGKDPKGAFGRGVKGVGDVNRDGFADVLIGEPYQIWGGPLNSDTVEQAGNAYLYSGKDGSVLYKWSGARIGDGFGTAVAGKTGSGQMLLMVGAPSAGDSNGGQVNVYNKLEAGPFFTMDADETGSSLGGMFLSVVGDINGDGFQDLYASDFSNNALGPATGKTYLHSGADGKPLFTLTGEAAGNGFGIGVADAADTNQDGYDDLVIGAWQYSTAAPSGGKVYVYSGKDGTVLRTITGKVVGETLGFDTTGIGDVNGDGIVDLLLTSAWSAINGVQSGRMYIISGK